MNEDTQNDIELDPSLYETIKPIDYTKDCLNEVGIETNSSKITEGFIKVFPSDFIVEEIGTDGRISTIDLAESFPADEESSNPKPQVEFDLVKAGLATIEVSKKLSETLAIPVDDIHFAGMKDSKAITSQKVVIGGKTKEEIKNLSLPKIFIKNAHYKKGSLNTGELIGNRFTILVRTKSKNNAQLVQKINDIQTNGFLNFFSLQRFGTRLLAHVIGQEIVNNHCEEATRLLLLAQSDHEHKLYRDIRSLAEKSWLSWAEMKNFFTPHPVYFAAEIAILSDLERGLNFFQAFKNQEWTTKIFIRAFTAYYFNKLLSKLNQEGISNIPELLPLLSKDQDVLNFYKENLPDITINWDNILTFPIEHLLSTKTQDVRTKIFPKFSQLIDLTAGYVFAFDLDKGAYATTLLSNFFDLMQYSTRPEWLNLEKIDTLRAVNRGNLKDIEERLGQ